MLSLQRQGRIGFYVPSSGEEAVQIGSVAALDGEDWIFPAYREPGFIRRSHVRIATDLMDVAVGRLRSMGVQLIGAAVNANNAEAKLFYSGLGWTLHRSRVPGWGPAAVEFVWRTTG